MSAVRSFLVFAGFSTFIACASYIWVPSFNGYLLGEDHGIENLTVTFYLFASLYALVLLRKQQTHKVILAAVALFALLGAMEELSYGERIFHFTPPSIGSVSIDTLHDLFYLAFKPVVHRAGSPLVPAWLLFLVTIGLFLALVAAHPALRRILRQPYGILFILITVMGCASLTIDLQHEYGLPFMLEELFEMEAAAALIFVCWSLQDADRVSSARTAMRSRPAVVLVFLPWLLVFASCAYYGTLPTIERARISAAGGNLFAFYELARMYDEGDGVPASHAEALKWALRGAEGGHADAQLLAAMQYYHGRGTAKDIGEAHRWCLEAAKRNHEWAQMHLGVMLYTGTGVEQNAAEAAAWLHKAAEHGLTRAESMLGYMYYVGDGVVADAAEAARWLHRAAEKGHAKAQFQLGLLYLAGAGVAKDEQRGRAWIEKAANQDNDQAQSFLASKARITKHAHDN